MKSKLTKLHTNFMMRMAGVTPDYEDGDHLLEVLGVIIIVVILLVFFRSKITDLFKNTINNTTTQVNNMLNPVPLQ